MKKYSLFIGTYCPLKQEHKEMIQQALDQGKNVCIGLRKIEGEIPVMERDVAIVAAFPKEVASGKLVMVHIPNIEEVCDISSVSI